MSAPACRLTVQGSPQQFAARDSRQLMLQVIACCLPGLLIVTWFSGAGTLCNIALAIPAALVLESVTQTLRGQPLLPVLRDNSALLTAVLLSLLLPPGVGWWLIVTGIGVAIVFAKQLFGGLGRNPLNPALCGYAFLLLVFPQQMTAQQDMTLAPLLEQQLVALGYLLGGLLLLRGRIISWHIPVAILVTLLPLSLAFCCLSSSAVSATPCFPLFGSATLLVAFFMATDPVSSPSTPLGKLLYGGIIGGSLYGISAWGSYPHAIAFAVLFGNLWTPVLDRMTLPRIYGHPRKGA